MSRDNHPKERQAKQLERKQKNQYSAGRDRILIVTEGSKTEPLYFQEIRKFYRLGTAHVKILPGAYGTSPQKIINFARDHLKSCSKWEQVFCVFDRDDHPDFNNALVSAASIDKKYKNEFKQPIRFTAIPSIPCFELWLLLHFKCITREIDRFDVIRQLGGPDCLPKYEKGQDGHFSRTCGKLSTAFQNADRLTVERERHGHENPYTAVHTLVKLLIEPGNI